MPLSPDEIRDYLLDELSPQRRADIEDRLRSDPAARAELERQRALLQAVRSLPEESVPTRMVFVRDPGAKPAKERLPRFNLPAWAAPLAVAAALVVAVVLGVWASEPALRLGDSGLTVSFGSGGALAEPWTEQRLRLVFREELARSETRWNLALREARRSSVSADWVRSEFESVRGDLADLHEDAVAGYEFVNAKHELLRRQLLEFDLASAAQVMP